MVTYKSFIWIYACDTITNNIAYVSANFSSMVLWSQATNTVYESSSIYVIIKTVILQNQSIKRSIQILLLPFVSVIKQYIYWNQSIPIEEQIHFCIMLQMLYNSSNPCLFCKTSYSIDKYWSLIILLTFFKIRLHISTLMLGSSTMCKMLYQQCIY